MSEKPMGRPSEDAKRPHTLYFPDDLWRALGAVKDETTVTAYIMKHLAAIPAVAAYLQKKRGKKS